MTRSKTTILPSLTYPYYTKILFGAITHSAGHLDTLASDFRFLAPYDPNTSHSSLWDIRILPVPSEHLEKPQLIANDSTVQIIDK
jgi:hypothetical protein